MSKKFLFLLCFFVISLLLYKMGIHKHQIKITSSTTTTFAKKNISSHTYSRFTSRKSTAHKSQTHKPQLSPPANQSTVTQALSIALDKNDSQAILKEINKLKKHPDPEVRMQALDAIPWSGDQGIELLLEFANDPSSDIRKQAVQSFITLVDEIESDSKKVIYFQATSSSPNKNLKKQSLESLAYLPELSAFPAISQFLNDSELSVQTLAIHILQQFSGEHFNSSQKALQWYQTHKNELEK